MNLLESIDAHVEVYRRMTGEQRLRIGMEFHELGRVLVRLGLRHEHPEWDEERIAREVKRQFLLAAGLAPSENLSEELRELLRHED